MMRMAMLAILTMAMGSAAMPSRAQTTSPDYPVCMRVHTIDGDHVECSFTSLEQCRQSASGRQASCAANPFAKPAAVPAQPNNRPPPRRAN